LAQFKPNDYLAAIDVQGITVQYTFATKAFTSLVLNQINELTHMAEKPCYGSNESGKGKKMVIDFSSPNIANYHRGVPDKSIPGERVGNRSLELPRRLGQAVWCALVR
jgi:arginyl-tRNA synthetase